MTFFDNPLIMILAFATSIAFTAVAAAIPPTAGNLVMGLFGSAMASFLGGEDEDDAYEREIADSDI